MKVFRMNECDWWVGPSLEVCIADYILQTGDAESVEDAEEVSDADLDALKLFDEESDERRSFREQLASEIQEGGEFPRFFASTEW